MDASTILVFGSVILGLGSLGFLVVRLTNRRLNGLGWLGGGFAIGGIGALLLLFTSLPPLLNVLCADLCTLLAFSLLHIAVVELTSDEPLVSPFGIALVVVLAVVDILRMGGHASGSARIAAISLTVAAQCFNTAWLLWRAARDKVRDPALFCAGLLFLFASFNLLRGLGVATGLLYHWHIAALVALAAFALYIAVALGLAFGFFWLTTTSFSAKLEDAAGTDPLTHLYNRRTFLRACEKELHVSAHHRRSFSVLMIDLDHFKAVNDRFGHPVGDAALLAVVECMQNSVRGIDVLARWGGEEFAALLPNSSHESAYLVAERMRNNIASIEVPLPERFPGDPPFLHLTASIGVATYQPSESIQTLLSRADRGLYLAKDSGRNRVLSSHT